MYVAETTWSREGARLDASLYVRSGARIHVMHTARVVVDARFLAPARVGSTVRNFFLILEGWIVVEGERMNAPCAFAVPTSEFENREPGARAFQLGGDPRRSIELCVGADDLHFPLGLAHRTQDIPQPIRLCAERLSSAASLPRDERIARCEALVDQLIASGICSLSRDDEAPALPVQRMLDSLSVLYREQNSAGYVELLASLANVSVRQATRDMASLARRFLLPYPTLREMFRVVRLRRATLLLSLPELSVDGVAREVGYGSRDGMARAFRDAHRARIQPAQPAARGAPQFLRAQN